MPRQALIVAAFLAAFGGLSPVYAQSWSFGVGVDYGVPIYGPPPVYGAPPVYGVPVYGEPPVIYAPAPVPRAVPPDTVFDLLEQDGYRDFGPMAFRDGVYKLNAVNIRGDLVSLEVSAITGAVEREYLVAGREAAAIPQPDPAPSLAAPPSAAPGSPNNREDPLVIY